MATSKEFLNYVLEQLRHIDGVSYKPMMGEYLLYYREKVIADICDNRVYIKPVSAAKALLPDADMQPPYNGAKPMLVLEELENKSFLEQLFDAMYPELPAPKPKKPKIKK